MTSKSPLELLNSSHQSEVLKAAIFSRFVLFILSIFWRTLLAPYDASLNPTCLRNPPLPSLFSFLSVPPSRTVSFGTMFTSSGSLSAGMNTSSPTRFCPYCRLVFLPFREQFSRHWFRLLVIEQCWRCLVMLFAMWRLFSRRCTFTVIILKDPNVALQASILFCFNPASIFYSSIYSESLYALFSVGGCYYLVSHANNIAAMHKAYDAFYLKKRAFLALWILIRGALRNLFNHLLCEVKT